MLSSWPSWLCLVRRPYLLNYMSNSTEIFCVDRLEAGLGTGQVSAQSDEKRLRSRVFHLTFTCFIRRSKGCTLSLYFQHLNQQEMLFPPLWKNEWQVIDLGEVEKLKNFVASAFSVSFLKYVLVLYK